MTIRKTSTCKYCGGVSKLYDRVPRLVRIGGGDKRWVKVKRFKCIECNKLYRELPDYIFPYKHYDGEIIKGVVEGYITPDILGFEDYPSEITMKRWREIYISLYER